MNENNGMMMMLGSWGVALAGGTLAGTMLWVVGGWTFFQGAFAGGVIFVLAGAIISWTMMRPLPAPNELELKTPDVPSKSPPQASPPKTSAPTVPKAAAKPAPKKAAPKKAAPKKPEPVAAEARPAVLTDAPSGGQADDLKKISGVGPKLEQTLNELGVWKYEQVAAFTAEDIAWVDERLRFKGRIERDDWIGQAKALAEGKG